MRDHDDLVDTHRLELVDHRLQDIGERRHVVRSRRDRRARGRRDLLEQRCGRTDDSDPLAATDVDQGCRRQLRYVQVAPRLCRTRCEEQVALDHIGGETTQRAVTGEVEVGPEVRELRPHPAVTRRTGSTPVLRRDDVAERVAPEVELVVADGRGVEPDHVHDRCVDPAPALAEPVVRGHPEVFVVDVVEQPTVAECSPVTRCAEERSRDVVVACGQRQRRIHVAVVFERVDDGGEVRRPVDGVYASLEVAGMQDLEIERRGRLHRIQLERREHRLVVATHRVDEPTREVHVDVHDIEV